MRFWFLLAVLLLPFCASAQSDGQTITFRFLFNNEPLELNKSYFVPALNDSVRLENVQLYVSNIAFLLNNQAVGRAEKVHCLLDVAQPASLTLPISLNQHSTFNAIRFDLGIDSLTQVSGAFGGDLDPTNGMYWTWQSGYINVKIEGTSNACPARKNQFQFHLGGYRQPFVALQKVEIAVHDSAPLVIAIALDELLSQLDLRNTFQVMSPSTQAVEIVQLMPAIFNLAK